LTKEIVWLFRRPGIIKDFDDQMHQNAAFPEAENILWDLRLQMTSIIHWILQRRGKSEDIASEFEGIVEEVTEENRINSDSNIDK
jgi:hypothetical protein